MRIPRLIAFITLFVVFFALARNIVEQEEKRIGPSPAYLAANDTNPPRNETEMKMHTITDTKRHTLITAIALSTLAALIAGNVGTTNAASVKTISCAALKYSIQVPSDWSLVQSCNKGVEYVASNDRNIVIGITTETHHSWTDAQARAEIRQLETTTYPASVKGVPLKPPVFYVYKIHGKHFIDGDDAVLLDTGTTQIESGLQTFANQKVYSFLGIINLSGNNTSDSYNATLMGLIWHTVQIGKM